MTKCSNCPDSYFGSRSALSDACDSCRDDDNVGWGGSVDHSRMSDESDDEDDFKVEDLFDDED